MSPVGKNTNPNPLLSFLVHYYPVVLAIVYGVLPTKLNPLPSHPPYSLCPVQSWVITFLEMKKILLGNNTEASGWTLYPTGVLETFCILIKVLPPHMSKILSYKICAFTVYLKQEKKKKKNWKGSILPDTVYLHCLELKLFPCNCGISNQIGPFNLLKVAEQKQI